MQQAVVVPLTAQTFCETGLDNFVRTQPVTRIWRHGTDGVYLEDRCFTQDWDLQKKRCFARMMIDDAHLSFGIYLGARLVGFYCLLREKNGSRVILELMQVDAGFRRHGYGRLLFCHAMRQAALIGAEELYVSACNAEETIAFYYAMGCRLTDSPIEAMALDEPFDLQLTVPIDRT